MKSKKVSLVVPCYNEEGNVNSFYEACEKTFSKIDKSIELIFVNDGSKDKTIKELEKILDKKTKFEIKVVNFSRNFGKESAVYAGLSNATGDYVCIIDADMQQPPQLTIEMMNILDENEEYDEVAYFQEKRIEGKLISGLKSSFYKVISKMSGIEFKNGASDFRMMRKYVVEAILSMSENNRFSKGIFSWIGFNIKYLPYVPEERNAGVSSFNAKKLFSYAFSGIIAFSIAPLKLATYAGILSSLISFIYLVVVILQKLIFGIAVSGYATIVVLILLLGGLNLLCLGIIGEYIARIYLETKKRPIYIAKSIKTNK